MRRLWGVCLLVLLSVVLARGATTTLTLLYTNDLHVHLERLGSLAELIATERATESPTLLVDAGDAWHDFRRPIFAVWGAEEMVAWMNEVGYDAMTIGNHDLYLGADRLDALAFAARFPLLAANLRSVLEFPPFLPHQTVTRGGLKVLLVGLVTEEHFPALEYPWLDLEDPEATLAKVLSEEEAQEADLVVVLGHLPLEEAVRIASRAPGIDVFVTGHSHQRTPDPVQAGGALVVQSGEFGEALGRLRLEIDFDTGAIVRAENSLLPTEEAPVALDRGYLKLFEILLGVAAFAFFLLF